MSHSAATAIHPDEWSRATTLLAAAEEVCLACHVTPDGDALGSMLGLAQALRARGQRTTASFGDDPFAVSPSLRFLAGLEMLSEPAEFPAAPDVMVTFDVASMERLGVLADSAVKARDLIVVDHHASNTRFGTVHLLDPTAAATAMLVDELIQRLGVPLTHGIALDLYAALATDTGSFRFAPTSPGVHEFAARLLRAGVRPDAVARHLWDGAPFAYLRLLAAALDRAVLEPQAAGGLGVVWTTVTRRDRDACGLPFALVEPVIDTVRLADEAEVAVVLKEDDQGAWRVSARSRGVVDVGGVCTALGGGGHAAAAGFTSYADVQRIMAQLRERLAQAGRGRVRD